MATGLRVPHYECEDCWYSCPKSPEGCCNDAMGTDCTCGAEKYNARFERLEAIITELLRYEHDSPHSHQRPGFWDGTNNPCVRCATYEVAREAVA